VLCSSDKFNTCVYYMKTNLKNLPVILLLASVLIMMMTSCKKDDKQFDTCLNNASAKILSGNGFEFTGIVQDDGIGDAWHWVYKESLNK
jgi:hypothetical protein